MASEPEQHGLFLLYPLSETADVDMDIVFVHGLGGDAFRTWTASNKTMWPRDFVPQIIPSARVMTFGYDSKWTFSPSTADIKDFALDLLSRLRSKRWSAKAMQNPIVFVCHSLGGIVCKKALILAQSEQYYTNIFEKTSAILFFGTPHRGSRVASWGTVMSNFINTCAFHQPLRRALLSDLSLSSTILAEISASFKRLAPNIDIKTFYETSMMLPLKGPVVERDSAILGFPNEQCIPIAANHREIVHFKSIDGQKFDPVKSSLKELQDGKRADLGVLRNTCNYLAGDVDIFGNYDSGLLGVADYDQQLFTIPIRAPGTCEWLPLHSSFSAWLTSSSSDLLWLRGYAGVGKSVITKYLITSVIGSNYVRSMKNAIPKKIEVSHHKHFLVYFFCNEGNHALRSEQNILRSVLHQFLLGAPVEVAQALQIFKSVTSDFGDYKFLYSTSALWDAIKAVLVAISWKVTYLVFDALDEMPPEDLRSFASGLRDLIDTVSSHIMPRSLKILITSRPTSCIEQAMSPASISIKSERDVRHLIEDRAKDLSQRYDLPVHVRNQIVTQICEKAGGMFLWACLAWEELCRGATKQSQFLLNLRKAQDLPATLESLYESLLSRLDSESLQLSLEAFPWLIAATRPLHTNELRFAMALDAEGSYNTICSRMMSESGIKTLCPSLIYVNEKGYVQFAHSSIRDFLTHQKTPNRFRFDPLAIHEKLAVLCLRSLYLPGFNAEATLTYLCSRTIRTEEEMVDLAAQYYLLPYASANWHVHANALGKSLAVWMAFKKFLNQITSVRLWLLLCLYDDSLLAQQGWSLYDFDWFSTHPPPPAVHLAVFLKNTYLIEMLVQNGSNINELNTGRWNRTPKYRIPYLPEEGSVLHFKDLEFDVIKCLLRLGADVNIRDSRGQSPVKNAIGQRNEGLVTMLIESAQERSPHTPIKYDPEILYWAAAATMLSTIKMVLDDPSVDLCNRAFLRIDNSVLGKYMTSPLEHACLFGMESVARIMISHPRMIEAHLKKEQKFGGRNPTSLAFLTTMQGWSDLTLIAIQTFPVDLASERDFDMRTILHHASMEEWHDVLEICISQLSRSKLNIQDKNGMSALHYAAKTRNWYAVGRLLEAGASSHIEDNEGRTAGHVAAEAGSDRVLNLMLEKGAVVAGSLDHRKRTVLHYTATWNLTSIAERLIEADDGCVTARDHDGRTAAHLAALFGSTAVLSVLLATGLIDLNAPDNYGKTLLHCAVEGRVGSCIDELLWRDGIELNPLDRHLKSPLDVTASFKDESQAVAISDQLKEAGCRPGLWRPRRVYGQAADSQAPPIPACPPTKILAMQIVRYEPELPPT